jgi:hypothetical protein
MSQIPEEKNFIKAINALLLELPEPVWNSFHYLWVQYQNSKLEELKGLRQENEKLKETLLSKSAKWYQNILNEQDSKITNLIRENDELQSELETLRKESDLLEAREVAWAARRDLYEEQLSELRKEKGMRWTNGRKTELLPPIDSYEDFPKKYVVRVYGDDPHSGCVYCGMETAEEMREINEDGYWEWLDESESPEQSSLSELQEELEEDLSTLVSIKDDLPKEGLGKIFVTNRIKKLQSLLTSTKEQKEDEV